MRDRPAVQVWLTVLGPGQAQDFDAVAVAAGLQPLERAWVEVDAERAEQVLASVLHKDLAYDAELMLEHRAKWLAAEFLSRFDRHQSRFATNRVELAEGASSWTPATDATFDTGLVIAGEAGSGLYWVADED